jgi:putative ABC transport system substrate-binding protein
LIEPGGRYESKGSLWRRKIVSQTGMGRNNSCRHFACSDPPFRHCSAGRAAQQPAKIPRLCFLTFDLGSAKAPSSRFATFFESLRELGYVHGQTISIEYLAADGRGNQFPDLAAECLRRKSDIIAVTTTPAAKAAKEATQAVPIVMVSLGDPVRTGLVNNLARPESNVTGMSNMGAELAAKRLALLKETVPTVSKVLVLTYLVDPFSMLPAEALKEASTSLGLTLLFRDIKIAEDSDGG